ncbi:MAG: hypothetical protein OXI43_13445 [Candidatus Poribacteria bacterium]|nr:hypothetical protein [Candidatus Poribacteria bacterium]
MNRKAFWIVSILISIIIAATAFIYWQATEMKHMRQQAAEFEKQLEEKEKPTIVKEEKPPPPGASPNGHWHNGVWCEDTHTTPNSQNPSDVNTVQLPVSTHPDATELVDIDTDKLMKSHPAFQEQAIADRKAVAVYHQKYKEHTKIYDEINTEWWAIKKEMDVLNKMPNDEFNNLPEAEKKELAKKYVQLQQQWDENRKRLATHKETKPVRPNDAFRRIQELEAIMPTHIDINTKGWK